jgi:hypothetical protein
MPMKRLDSAATASRLSLLVEDKVDRSLDTVSMYFLSCSLKTSVRLASSFMLFTEFSFTEPSGLSHHQKQMQT